MAHENQRFDNLHGRLIDGRYRLGARLGEGGFGLIYEAVQVAMNREVVIKVLPSALATNSEARHRFRREAQAASSLSHPNVVTVHDFGCTRDGLPYIVMERVRGGTLADLVALGPLSPERAAWLVGQVLHAVQEAHAAGIVHRDLKPQNVLVTYAGGGAEHVKVVDFGLARLMDSSVTAITCPGRALGSPLFMSPEQARGDVVGPRADLYACGALLFTLLTGRPPFVGRTPVAIAAQHLVAPVPGFDAPGGLQLVVRRALAKRPEDRFGSAREMCAALGRAMASDRRRRPTATGRAGVFPTLRMTA